MNYCYMDIMQICCNTSAIDLSNDKPLSELKGVDKEHVQNSTLTIKCQISNRTCVLAAEVSCFTTTYYVCKQMRFVKSIFNKYCS